MKIKQKQYFLFLKIIACINEIDYFNERKEIDMIVNGYQLTFIIYDSYSLKDKRRVMKSIIKKMHNKYNISIAEVGKLDKLNQGMLGIAIVGNDAVFCQKVFDQVLNEIEANYEIEVHEIQKY